MDNFWQFFIFLSCPFIFLSLPFISFHFPFVPFSSFIFFHFIFLSFPLIFISFPFICFHFPFISLRKVSRKVIWEKPRKHMETPMAPRCSTPESIQLIFFGGGGLELEILFFFFHLCLGCIAFVYLFKLQIISTHVSSMCQFARVQYAFLFLFIYTHVVSFPFSFICNFIGRLVRVPRSFPFSFICRLARVPSHFLPFPWFILLISSFSLSAAPEIQEASEKQWKTIKKKIHIYQENIRKQTSKWKKWKKWKQNPTPPHPPPLSVPSPRSKSFPPHTLPPAPPVFRDPALKKMYLTFLTLPPSKRALVGGHIL